MSKEINAYKIKLRPYHIVLISCLLSTLIIMNSNYINQQREELRLNKEKGELFTKIIKGRMLEGTNGNEDENIKEICSRADDDLQDYYKTGDLSKIDLDNGPIECEDKNKDYMKTLIDIVKNYAGNDEDDDDRRLRNLGGDLDTNQLIDYGMRLLPMIIFFAIGILSIFGWIGCCIFCCCDCCCCCCCKKDGCRIPCFIFTYIFYALVVAVSVYGLTQSKKIFVGLANTECSLLKFFEQVLHGEIKQDNPRWAGISGINQLLLDLKNTIINIKNDVKDDINTEFSSNNGRRVGFISNLEDAERKFFDGTNYNSQYKKNYRTKNINGYPLNDDYVLDIVKFFGKKDSDNNYEENTFLYYMNEEFSIVAENADNFLGEAKRGFDKILDDTSADNPFQTVIDGLDEGRKNLNELTQPFTDLKTDIGDLLSSFAGDADKYGKMGVTVVFSVLMGMNIFLAVLMLLIYCFSTRSFASCCCCRCMFKFCTHILWNILALFMILAFIIGSILGIVGSIGGDMMSLVSYIMSEDNFRDSNTLLLDQLGQAKDYIYTCIHGDGDISQNLHLGNSLESFNLINEAESQINEAKSHFDEVKEQSPSFNIFKGRFDNQKEYKEEIGLLPIQGEANDRKLIGYNAFLRVISETDGIAIENYRWSNTSTKEYSCSQPLSEGEFYHPKHCQPYSNDVTIPSTNTEFGKYASILKDIDDMMNYAKGTNDDSVEKVITDLKTKYNTVLNGYVDVLDVFNDAIHDITNLVRQYASDDNAFSFLNGKFIGTNLKIILKYLKYSLGVDIYTVGLCLVIVGFSLILSISSTILLLVNINMELKKNMAPRPPVIPTPGVTTVSQYAVVTPVA